MQGRMTEKTVDRFEFAVVTEDSGALVPSSQSTTALRQLPIEAFSTPKDVCSVELMRAAFKGLLAD
jgi:hypothetical protein